MKMASFGKLLFFGFVTVIAFGGAHQTTVWAQEQAAAADTSTDTADDAPAPLTDDELEVLVARIALYPDELVALVTSASLFPLQIVEASRFLDDLAKDKSLKPKESWDGSVISLLNYPQIVKMMSDDLEWTQSLGEALGYQQKDVLIAIQQLREKAVADGVIKTDDKMKVETQNNNIVIQSASSESIYVPQYEPQMLYDPGYQPVPVSYYPDPYPYYYDPTAAFFAGAVTGAIWGAAMDWDDWGVWGGRWDRGDIDIDCDHCFNNINGKVNWNDVDWKNVDRSKIKFDKNQFNKIDRTKIKNDFTSNKVNNIGNRAKSVRNENSGNIRNNVNKISVDDVRKSKVDANKLNNARNNANASNRKPAGNIANRPAASQKIDNVRRDPKPSHQISKPRPGGNIERPNNGRPSALGHVQSGKHTQLQSDRGRQSMGGGHRGGGQPHRNIQRGGGGGRHR